MEDRIVVAKGDLGADGDHQHVRHEHLAALADHLAVRGRGARRLAVGPLQPDDRAARPVRAAARDGAAHADRRVRGRRDGRRRAVDEDAGRRRRWRRRLGGGPTGGAAARLVRQRPDRLVELGIERVDLQQRLPLRRGGREVAAVPGQLAAGEQIEDEVLLLRRRLHRQVLRRAHGERQRQLLAEPAARIRRRRRGDRRRCERAPPPAAFRLRFAPHRIVTSYTPTTR